MNQELYKLLLSFIKHRDNKNKFVRIQNYELAAIERELERQSIIDIYNIMPKEYKMDLGDDDIIYPESEHLIKWNSIYSYINKYINNFNINLDDNIRLVNRIYNLSNLKI